LFDFSSACLIVCRSCCNALYMYLVILSLLLYCRSSLELRHFPNFPCRQMCLSAPSTAG
jgi:hypothetical protein